MGLGLIAATLAKLLWWRTLKPVSWRRLWMATTVAATLALVGGLVVLGRDGRIATYAAMVLATAASLWWIGFLRSGKR